MPGRRSGSTGKETSAQSEAPIGYRKAPRRKKKVLPADLDFSEEELLLGWGEFIRLVKRIGCRVTLHRQFCSRFEYHAEIDLRRSLASQSALKAAGDGRSEPQAFMLPWKESHLPAPSPQWRRRDPSSHPSAAHTRHVPSLLHAL